VSVIVCSFHGWMQVRLATNPDPTDELRGVSGYTFALPGEPDLDRVLRSRDPVAPRTHGPPIGVAVHRVTVDGHEVGGHPLLGARFDLVGDALFESVNEVIYTMGEEPLEPFEVQLSHGAFALRRRAFLDPTRPGATVYDVPRALLDAHASDVTLGDQIMIEATGAGDPVAFRARRLALLREDLATCTDPAQRAGLGRRISELEITAPTDHRTQSMLFIETRHYPLNGPTTITDPERWLGTLDTYADFPCDLILGSWDADALSAYAAGTLTLPTH